MKRVAPAVALACVLAACRGEGSLDRRRAAALFTRVTIDTHGIHGLSGLAVDADGAVWAVAERGKTAFRLTLDGTTLSSTTAFPVDGLPPGNDLESAAFLGDGDMIVGTESNTAGVAYLFRLHRDGDRLRVVDPPLEITRADAGIAVEADHGAEAVCAVGSTVVLALETVGQDAAGRWAPLVIVDLATGARAAHRVRLRTDRGKLSGLDCWAEGTAVHAVAIERHFAVTQLVALEVPPITAPSSDITTALVLDLAPVLRGSLNLEGIVRFPDGHLAAVVDNQYKTITGPDEVLVFKTRPPRDPDPAPAPAP
jgi:hypothetical protein